MRESILDRKSDTAQHRVAKATAAPHRPQGPRTDEAVAGSGRSPLGNNAIFPALFEKTAVDPETGEIRRVEFDRSGRPVLAPPSRSERLALMYMRKAATDKLLQLLPKREDGQPHRTFKCHRVPLPSSQVAAMYSEEYSKAFLAGLQVCANPWLCPICMRKLSEKKKVEVETGIELAKAMGRRAVLLTLTFRHDHGDRLADLLQALLKAFEHGFSKNKGGKVFKQSLGLLGMIKALEITCGRDNGFHPHLHVLLFIDKTAPDVEAIQRMASAIWTKACKAVGRHADPKIGANAQEGNSAGAYLSKMGLDDKKAEWSLGAEMTKGASKNGRATGLGALQLLDLAAAGDKQAIAAWVEYATATVGKHPLRWGPGLRKKLGMAKARTDEELAAETEDESARVFTLFTGAAWKHIYTKGLWPYLATLIEADFDHARAFIADIEKQQAKEKRQ